MISVNSSAIRTGGVRSRGFTFIELLVALLILGVGIGSLVTLQSTFIRSTALAAERNAAMDIAQSRLEQLRATEFAAISAGSESVTSTQQTFAVQWQVTDQFYDGQWFAADSEVLPAKFSTTPAPTPHAKSVSVQVSWQARGGATEQIEVPGWSAALQLRDGQRVAREPSVRADPRVVYNPGAAPEVIAIKLEENSAASEYFVKETSKPTPQVSRSGEYLQVSFDAVTYDEATQTQRIEDFMTLNCRCTLQASGQGATPNRMALIDGELQLDTAASEFIEKNVGVSADANQPALCNQCCRDHHDSSAMVADGNLYQQTDNRTASGNHRHYNEVNGSLVEAGVGDQYLEACRMRRVDGYYAPFADWQLQSVVLMSAAYLTQSDSASVYEAYIQQAVRAMVTGEPLPQPPTGRDLNVAPGAYQLIGRGVYLDEMDAAHEQEVLTRLQNGETDWLRIVPFYEVNLTLLSDWESDNAVVASVTNEPIGTIVDPENSFYGTYSRGRLQAEQNGMSVVNMQVLGGNSGVIGSAATNPVDAGRVFTDAVNVTVTAQDENTDLFSVTGEINCLDALGSSCKNNQLRNVNVTISDLNLSCEYQTGGRNQTPFYSCANIPAGWSGLITFAKEGFSFTPAQVSIDNLSGNRQFNILMQE